jgi:hypothetical protein
MCCCLRCQQWTVVENAAMCSGTGARGVGEQEGAKKPSQSQRTRRTRCSRITASRDLAGGCLGAGMAAGAATRCLSGCFERSAGQ